MPAGAKIRGFLGEGQEIRFGEWGKGGFMYLDKQGGRGYSMWGGRLGGGGRVINTRR